MKRALVRYAVAATLARLADEMVGVAVVLFVLARTDSGVLAGAAVAGYTLPAVLTGPLLGAWLAGAGRRAPLALAANELVLAAVAVGLVLTVGHAPAPLVVLLTVLAGVSLPLTSAGYSSLLPAIVGRAGLAKANTVDAVSVNGPALAGPAIAGTLAGVFGAGAAVLGIGVIALLATVATFALPRASAATRSTRSLLALARAGLTHLSRTPPLRSATFVSAVGYGCVGLLVVALPARMVELGVPRTSSGYLWTAFEVGGLLSIVLLGARLRALRPERVVYVTVTGYGVLLAVLAVTPNLATTLVVAVLAGAAEGPTLPAVFAARQRYSPDHLLAQVSTTGVSLKIGAFSLGSVLSGALTGELGPATLFLVAAAGQFVAVGVGWAIGRGAVAEKPVTTSESPR
jgi:MFS family permease